MSDTGDQPTPNTTPPGGEVNVNDPRGDVTVNQPPPAAAPAEEPSSGK